MSDRKQALVELRDQVKAGNRNIFGGMTSAMLHTFEQREINWIQSAHDGSLDAAKALHEAVLPGWLWLRSATGNIAVSSGLGREMYYGVSDDPARAKVER